jgi:hypothetical protein
MVQTKLIPAQSLTFSDWCAEVRDLPASAGLKSRTNARPSMPCGAAATPAQALHMVSLILPPKAEA